MSVLSSYERYIMGIMPSCEGYDPTAKSTNISQYISYMLARTQAMFKWSGLPEEIPQRILELYLQVNGSCIFAEVDGKLYVFTGGAGGEPDANYMPTIYTVANPALKLSRMFKIGKDCIWMPNDSMYIGLYPLMKKYASQMVETDLSIDMAAVNARIFSFITAPDDRTKAAADKYLKDVRDGKSGAIADNQFLDGIRAQPYAAAGVQNMIINLIELLQYQKASFYNEIGLNANYNMKRESLNSNESQLNNDALLPLVDDMLNCRKTFAEKVNEMFGTNISVELASSWEDNVTEIKLEQDLMEADADPDPDDPDQDPVDDQDQEPKEGDDNGED